MKAIQACRPSSSSFLYPPALKPLVDNYNLDNSIYIEAGMAKQTLQNKELSHISDVYLYLSSLKAAFPNLFKLVRIEMTIAISTAHCERSFSALKRIKTYLTSIMGEQRLSDLAILSVKKELSGTLDISQVLYEFIHRNKNRKIIVLKLIIINN